MSRREEWLQQIRLKELLEKWLPADVFWTAIESVAASAQSGYVRKRRGVRSGVPDVLAIYRGKPIFVELKSRVGHCSTAQRRCRELLLRAGVQWWWVVRSARAALVAMHRSGVQFREIERADGTIERWQPPRLEAWEEPRRDPKEPRPKAPEARRARPRGARLRRKGTFREAAE